MLDLISRKAVLDALGEPHPMDYNACSVVRLVKDIPAIEAAPVKHGRWLPVLNGKDDDSNPAFDCSECDAMCRKQHNYCPRCGAKMDLEE